MIPTMRRGRKLATVLFPLLCLAAVLVGWSALHSADAPDATIADGSGSVEGEGLAGGRSSYPGLLFRVVLALGLIVLLIFGAVWALRVFGGRAGIPAAGKVKVLDRCYLAPKRALYTVRMGARTVVVGVTETAITPVMELSSEEGERLYPNPPEGIEAAEGFPAILRGVAAKMGRGRA
ncbi:MAG: flagellar biosynthetic protein FliO [Candidatus Eisenbacteria bacterium]|nr:flagellar biosynthetic protein FliO [Candidatus Eisenbacteria bacterium]